MVSRDVLGQEFEGDLPSEVGVFGKIDDAHTSVAQLANNPVMRNGLPNQGWCCGHGAILAEEARWPAVKPLCRLHFPNVNLLDYTATSMLLPGLYLRLKMFLPLFVQP